MANVWAIKSGDWNDVTVWNTGALPTSTDDIYANNFSININQNITVNSLRNTANTGITAGGTFTFNTGNITVNISNTIFYTTATIFSITATSGLVTINITNANILVNTNVELIKHTGNCNLTISLISLGSGGDPYINKSVLTKTSNGNLTITGNIIGTSGANYTKNTIYNSGGGNINIIGNVTGGGTIQNAPAILVEGSANLTVNGNVTGASGSLGGYATIVFSSSGTCSIIGNLTGNVSAGLYLLAGTANVNGTIAGGNFAGVVGVIVQNAILNHVGTVQASAFASAISCNSPITSTVICTGPFLKNGYIVAIASQTLRINFNSNSYFQFKKSNGEDIDYVSTVEGYNYPTPADVRYGVSYKSGLAIGTCHVPTPDNVRKNIPVDNTVGTSDNVNADDILQAIQDSSLPIAQRLRNVATVESTGAQLEAYQ